ncbi:hypothetical protein [Mesorhizobium cantuariense]|uniref:Transport-associated OB type 2 domain-containing protein n=2 Tax=Mesorhizobium TaxID=68287 RepID=A0ABV7MH23_9HYPH
MLVLMPEHRPICAISKIRSPDAYAEVAGLGVSADAWQPDGNQTNRGTVFTRVWSGAQAAVVAEGMSLRLKIQRDADPAAPVDELVPFGLAVSLAMPGEIRLYDQVRARVQPRPAQRAAP